MKNMLLGILISAHILIVSSQHTSCAGGEPLVGESQPDVNITSPKVLSIPEFNPLVIFCNADVARFPSESPPEPPTKIIIQIGTYKVKECENGGLPVKECFYYLGSYFPALPRTINCTAVNALGECRFKTSEIQLLSSSASTDLPQQGNMTTMSPNATTASPGNTTTTSAPPPPTVATTTAPSGTVPTPTPTTDDGDEDSDDDDSDDDDDDEDNDDDSDGDSDADSDDD